MQHIEFGDGSAAIAALAEAFDYFIEMLDDFDLSEICAAASVASVPGWARPKRKPPPFIGRRYVWIRVVQRTVKAGGRLHPRQQTQHRRICIKLHERPRMGRGRFFREGGVHMPSIITREGVVIQQEALTQEQKEQGWAIVLRRFLELHPEMLNTVGQGEAASAQAQS